MAVVRDGMVVLAVCYWWRSCVMVDGGPEQPGSLNIAACVLECATINLQLAFSRKLLYPRSRNSAYE